MLTPKYKRYVERINELIKEGQEISKLEKPSSVGPFVQGVGKTGSGLHY